ncbi:anaerobic ribonucleoside-triphosphate reductase [bacterium]|uniref:anaerobic ribonucleoside-triphosphate reductase n=1 Tax=Gemmiger sp. TaxID=2049027 RepID=UPI002A9136A3|nr:anaerobic ribonucleoside-triphosphate reductase [Gemmiger sp.]MCI6084450.1 anaerobic ribonucleoside-triphosphate reductase [bacterium]MCI6247752.1 anaerobic ribonucleoside-triphosphate reductase [bacterium]MCI7192625.1 anaerobic ribonucleoside-triphosphate reductase [bacterium]MCI7324219.1 anaerobic ribonucleoside-triphosphate reductase [bacterium]MCI7743816.1 anaerobic ribonucleoside-triphosphate reductase [bacterium]
MKIIKRNGSEAVFDITKIIAAVTKANNVVPANQRLTKEQILSIADDVSRQCQSRGHAMNVEEIQDLVEDAIMGTGACEVARKYITYRYVQSLKRTHNTTDDRILSLIECNNEEVKQENANKNPTVNSVQRDYMAGEVSKDLTMRMLLPADIVKAHEEGIIHFHDADYYAQHMHNCDLVNLEDMLQNGTVISGTLIEKPHSFSTACNIATQIIAQVASNQYGGQSISLTHLAPFVDISRKKIRRDTEAEMRELGIDPGEEKLSKIVEDRLREEIKRGVQTIQYQVVTLMTTNGQAPFITVFMYLNEAGDDQRLKADLAIIIEEMLRQRYQGVKNEEGVWITPAFPKLIYVLEEDNIREGTPYFYLTKLAAKCTAKRMVPDYISEKKMLEYKVDKNGEGHCYTCMGCRSFLTPYVDENGKPKYYGRFNQGVVTINLPDVALSSGGDMEKFWKIFDERLELCHRALQCRHNRLKGTLSDAAPILWQYGALARLKKGEPIDKLLYGGYSTISLGYAGLYECCKYMTGKSHTDPAAKPFALEVMQHMNDKCQEWKRAENIDYSLYGTPLESTTYKFAKCLQKRFGIVPGITDRNYITNSYHVHVTEQIDAFTKLQFESEFQRLSPGGAISYVEVPNMQDNLEAVIQVMQFIYDNIMYAELNTKSDYCQVCGYDGEIKIVEDDGKLVWECPHCHNRDQSKLNVARRTCGYIGTQFWNQGRTAEIKDRVLHL